MNQNFICKDCGQPFFITEEEAKKFTDRGFKLPVRCATCRAKRRELQEIAVTTTCKMCGKPFSVTKQQKNWYESHELAMPTHCPACIAKRKAMIKK